MALFVILAIVFDGHEAPGLLCIATVVDAQLPLTFENAAVETDSDAIAVFCLGTGAYSSIAVICLLQMCHVLFSELGSNAVS